MASKWKMKGDNSEQPLDTMKNLAKESMSATPMQPTEKPEPSLLNDKVLEQACRNSFEEQYDKKEAVVAQFHWLTKNTGHNEWIEKAKECYHMCVMANKATLYLNAALHERAVHQEGPARGVCGEVSASKCSG